MVTRNVRIVIRLSEQEHAEWLAAAEEDRLDLSNWLRLTLRKHTNLPATPEEKEAAKKTAQDEKAKAKKAAQDEQANAAMLRKYTNMGLKVLGPDTGVRPPIVVDLDSVKLHEPTPRDLAYTRARLKLGRPPTNREVEEELRGKTPPDLDDPTD